MDLRQTQTQQLSQQQLLSVELLQLSTLELEAYIHELALSNPLVEPEDPASVQAPRQDDDLLRKLRWLEDNDHQNRFYQHMGEEELDPLAMVGTDGGLEETLFRFLSRQIHRLDLDTDTAQTVRYLAACLDDNGYFRTPLEELSQNFGISILQLEDGLRILRSLEPAGVGAANLSECLVLQLQRIRETGPALAIAQNHLPLLAKHQYKAIATALGVSLADVQAAEQIIRELEPRPGAIFQRPEQVPYIMPDVFVEESDGQWTVRTRRSEQPAFQINHYYRTLLAQSSDPSVREYLNGKLRQAENVLWAIGQRERTLLNCAQVIVARQQAFFRQGPRALLPLRLADVAQELEIHESTVSRTVREKYLQCSRGVYPMSYFFSRRATADENTTALGGTAARTLLRQLVDQEDKKHPLSDQKLCERLAQENCPISRRTVAKYREEMNIPSASHRKIL